MWITAWILVGSATLNQPSYPPFYSQADCERAREVYISARNERAARCIEARMFAATK